MKQFTNRGIALLLVFMMVFSLLPTAAFADEDAAVQEIVEAVETEETQDDAIIEEASEEADEESEIAQEAEPVDSRQTEEADDELTVADDGDEATLDAAEDGETTENGEDEENEEPALIEQPSYSISTARDGDVETLRVPYRSSYGYVYVKFDVDPELVQKISGGYFSNPDLGYGQIGYADNHTGYYSASDKTRGAWYVDMTHASVHNPYLGSAIFSVTLTLTNGQSFVYQIPTEIYADVLSVYPANGLKLTVGESEPTEAYYHNSVKANATAGTYVKRPETVWTSSDESVATVDENGVVTAVAPGEATITVAHVSGAVSNTIAVTVEEDELIFEYDADTDSMTISGAGLLSQDRYARALAQYGLSANPTNLTIHGENIWTRDYRNGGVVKFIAGNLVIDSLDMSGIAFYPNGAGATAVYTDTHVPALTNYWGNLEAASVTVSGGSVGASVFSNAPVGSVTISGSAVGASAFSGATASAVSISDSAIDARAFYNARVSGSITVSGGTVSDLAFYNTSASDVELSGVTFGEYSYGPLYNTTANTLVVDGGTLTKFALNSCYATNVTVRNFEVIPTHSIYNAYMTGLTVENIGSIESYGLRNLKNVSTLTMNNVTTVDRYAVYFMTSLTTLELSNIGTVAGYGFYNYGGSLWKLATVHLDGVARLESYAFTGINSGSRYPSAITTFTGLPTVGFIGGRAIHNCDAITNHDAAEITEATQIGWNQLFVGIPELEARMEGLLDGDFTLSEYAEGEELTVDDLLSALADDKDVSYRIGDNNGTGNGDTQIIETAEWSDVEKTVADVEIQFSESHEGMDFLFVVDLSDSMSRIGNEEADGDARFYAMQSKLLDVTGQLLDSEKGYDNQVAMVTFGGYYGGNATFTKSDFTSDLEAMQSMIRSLAPYYENTDYISALSMAADVVNAHRESRPGRELAVIFISDGQPTKNGEADFRADTDENVALIANSAEALKRAQDADEDDVKVFGVMQSVPTNEEANAIRAMNAICTEGLFFKATDTEEFSQAINNAMAASYGVYTVTQTIGKDFDLATDEEGNYVISVSAGETKVIRNEDGTTSIIWKLYAMPYETYTMNYQERLREGEDGLLPLGEFDINLQEKASEEPKEDNGDDNSMDAASEDADPGKTSVSALGQDGTVNTVDTPILARYTDYTLNYDANGGENAPASVTTPKTAETSNDFQLSGSASRQNYKFIGWGLFADATARDAVTEAQAKYGVNDGTVTVYAIWEQYDYTLIYDANGGENAPASVTSDKTGDESYTFQVSGEATRQNFKFMGWGASADATNVIDAATAINGVNNNTVTVYAIWEQYDYTLIYDANGGENAPASVTSDKTADESYTFAVSGEATRENFKFIGWGASADATETVDAATAINGVDNNTVTVYAIWEQYDYTLIYDANGGENAPASVTSDKTADESYTFAVSGEATRENFKFIGWGASADATNVIDAATAINGVDGNAVTVYAIWTQYDYTLIYDANGGENAPEAVMSGKTGADSFTFGLSGDATRDGFTFIGWGATEDATEAVETATALNGINGNVVTVYAIWEEVQTNRPVPFNPNNNEPTEIPDEDVPLSETPVVIDDENVPLNETPVLIDDENVPLSETPVEITDDDVPLSNAPATTPAPTSPAPRTNEVTIQDQNVPLADAPNTGDSSHTNLWVALGLFAALGMGVLTVGQKRRTVR